MQKLQTPAIFILTAVYLCFELAFNARLLDVVGGTASQEQIHNIEIFGRSLSGCAVALIMLQWMLSLHKDGSGPGLVSILFAVAGSFALTYIALNAFVEWRVAQSTPSFRHASQNILLVQRALVQGNVELDGLTDEPGLFAQPAGKAFLAQFPLMATSINNLDTKIHDAKLNLIAQQVSRQLGGPGGFYRESYLKAVQSTQERWQQYNRMPSAGDMSSSVAAQEDKAWNKYVSDLGRRGWTPSTVPGYARSAVVRKVRAEIPVPASWDPGDEASFREAVVTRARQRLGAAGSRAPSAGGQKLPTGLSWPAFFAHPGVQTELRQRLRLPARVTLQPAYANAVSFQREVFDPLVAEIARKELVHYDAPVSNFATGAPLAEKGLEAARMAIVPPLALFFSLLGAMTHTGKLCYLGLKFVCNVVPALARRRLVLWPMIVLIVIALGGALRLTSTPVAESRLYAYMSSQIHESGDQGSTFDWIWSRAKTNGLHIVAVGQDIGYPYFERIRTDLLGGITYGYQDNAH
jgi:hypothetical protein